MRRPSKPAKLDCSLLLFFMAVRCDARFSDSFAIEVSIYALLQPAVKSSHQWVQVSDLAPLKTDTAYVCADTGVLHCSALPLIMQHGTQ